jgi:hypothetical protein
MRKNEVQITDMYNTYKFTEAHMVKYYIKNKTAVVCYGNNLKTTVTDVTDMTCGENVHLEIVTL